jgi:hypothetical protein
MWGVEVLTGWLLGGPRALAGVRNTGTPNPTLSAKQQNLAYLCRYLSSKHECIHHIMKKQAVKCCIWDFLDSVEYIKKRAKACDVNHRFCVFFCTAVIHRREEKKRTPMSCLAVNYRSTFCSVYKFIKLGNNHRWLQCDAKQATGRPMTERIQHNRRKENGETQRLGIFHKKGRNKPGKKEVDVDNRCVNGCKTTIHVLRF